MRYGCAIAIAEPKHPRVERSAASAGHGSGTGFRRRRGILIGKPRIPTLFRRKDPSSACGRGRPRYSRPPPAETLTFLETPGDSIGLRWIDRQRRIWRLAGPVILSNATTPLLGAVDTGVVGRLADPALIGGVALGAIVFAFIFWGFGFLRMGRS